MASHKHMLFKSCDCIFSSCLNVRSDVINRGGGAGARREGGYTRGAVRKQIAFFILEEISPIYDTVFPKAKEETVLGEFR